MPKRSRSRSRLAPPGRGDAGGGEQSDGEDGGGGERKNDALNEKLVVAVRIRPLRQDEKQRGFQVVAEKVDEKMVVLLDPPQSQDSRQKNVLRQNRASERQYLYDAAFGADSTQEEVYERTTKPLVEAVMQGYNACVFAYGATGGGKTHTMVGTQDNPGCMVRALNDLFLAMEQDGENNFKVSMSYLEIYNENIRDLLNTSSGYLDLREDSKGRNIQVANLSEIATKSTEEVMRLLHRGNKERTQEPTAANKTSSRSHALLMVNVNQTSKSRASSRGAARTGRLYMIDLAGSERAAQTQNRGKRLKEGAHINRSLLALGNCINALAEGKAKYVNYRDSKLTRLLKDPLSGNCHTVMIAHISPADRHRDESRNTLVYADRAKNISNKVRKNVLDVSYHVSQYQTIISELRHEIGRLKDKIQTEGVEDKGKGAEKMGEKATTANKKQAEELRELREIMVINFNEQMKLRSQLMKIDNHILSLSMEFEKNNLIISDWESDRTKRRFRQGQEVVSRKERRRRRRRQQQQGDDEEGGFGLGGDNRGDEADNEESGFEDEMTGSTSEDRRDLDPERSGESDAEYPETIFDEPDEVRQAWEELVLIQKEQERYAGIKMDLEQDLQECRKGGKKLEDELPKRISTEEEREILSLLCKVHELEIEKVEMQSNSLLKEYEVRRRDLLIIKYDKQRSLSDEIIQRQRQLLEAMEISKQNGSSYGRGHSLPMPPELMELYNLYQQELETRDSNERETLLVSEAKEILRTPSMLSLRPELDDKPFYEETHRLPPIRQETTTGDERLFESRKDFRRYDDMDNDNFRRNESRLSITSPSSSAGGRGGRTSPLPPIDRDRRRKSLDSDQLRIRLDRKPSPTTRRRASRIPVTKERLASRSRRSSVDNNERDLKRSYSDYDGDRERGSKNRERGSGHRDSRHAGNRKERERSRQPNRDRSSSADPRPTPPRPSSRGRSSKPTPPRPTLTRARSASLSRLPRLPPIGGDKGDRRR